MSLKKTVNQEALKLRVQGYSYAEIQGELGIAYEDARRGIAKEMQLINKHLQETAWESRQLDLLRLDAVVKTSMETLEQEYEDEETGQVTKITNHKSADTLLKAMNHRAKLLGLYAEEPAPMNTLATKVNELLKKDVSEMSDEELNQFFKEHWEQEKKNNVNIGRLHG